MGQAMRRNFPKPMAPARFKGWQERPSGRPPIELWNLTHDIPGHPAGSTVTRETIERAGLYLPDPPEPAPNPQRGHFELTPETITMVLKWLEQHHGDTEGLARWMRDALHIGGIRECRQIIKLALGKDWIERMKRNPCHGARRRNPEEEDEDSEAGPEEEDYTITPTGPLGSKEGVAQGGKFLGAFSSRAAAERFIRDRMAREQFFPGVWYVSDHGNAYPIAFRGPSKKQIAKHHKANPHPLGKCGICGYEAGPFTGPEHEPHCPRYQKPRRRVTTISRRKPSNRALANPPRGRTLIYTGGRIRGTWYGRHRNGKLYKHRFGGGSKAIYGLPDGSIQIVPDKGRLWGMH